VPLEDAPAFLERLMRSRQDFVQIVFKVSQ
jgi:hypothetical protein